MADTKISALPASTVPLAGTEVLPIVQSSSTKQVSVANLTAGRAISATQLTLTTGNLIVANGQGIDFSATPGTGTSELLADYEEGTWTPGFAAWTTAPTINASYCRYTKIGRQVTIVMLCQNGVCGSTSQPITGLPFTSDSVSVASFRDASGGGSTSFGVVDIGTQITSITAVVFTGLFWGMSATYFV
jgi:hypothetical protein